jgi:hypothetical protein
VIRTLIYFLANLAIATPALAKDAQLNGMTEETTGD